MLCRRRKKPQKRDLFNKNNTNEWIRSHEENKRIVGHMPNSVMNHLLSGGRNNNEQFDQSDSEPKTDDHYAKTMKAAEKKFKEKGTGEDSVRLLKNSLGNIELSCMMLLSRDNTLEDIVNELEKVRKKMDFQREKEEIEHILNKIAAWLDRYGGEDQINSITDQFRSCDLISNKNIEK